MLTLIDVPEPLSSMYEQSKEKSKQIYDLIKGISEEHQVAREINIFDSFSGFVFINNGYYKFFNANKFIRFFSNDDAIWLENKSLFQQCKLTSECASLITVIKKNDLLKSLSSNSKLLETWISWQELEDQITRLLCSLYIQDDAMPNIEVKHAGKGDVIITEGDEPDKIFIMIEGSARVVSNGKDVGSIGPDEIFGEISFFTNQPRTTSVIAVTDCMIQAMDYDDFLRIIPIRPNLIMTLSKSLSNRIVKLNELLTKKSL